MLERRKKKNALCYANMIIIAIYRQFLNIIILFIFPLPSEKGNTKIKINLIILSFERIANNYPLTLLSRQYNEPKF